MTNPNHLILPSRFGFAETLAVLKQAFAAKQITLFAEIPHSALAAEHGLRNGFKTQINTGSGGGQEVFHLHVHIMGTPV